MTCPKSCHQLVTKFRSQVPHVFHSIKLSHNTPQWVVKSSGTLVTGNVNEMYKTSLSHQSCQQPFGYTKSKLIANVYSTCMDGCLTHIISKTELLTFFSNTFFGRLFQVLRPKYYSLSMTVYLSSHLLVNPSAHTISYFPNIQISIIKYWWNKHSESLLTTFYHIYCHHHGPSLRQLSDYCRNHLTSLPTSITAPQNLLNIVAVKAYMRSCHIPNKMTFQQFPNSR